MIPEPRNSQPIEDPHPQGGSPRVAVYALALLVAAALVAAFLFTACATAGPSQELKDARASVSRVAAGEAPLLAPDHLLAASQALDRAERAHDADPGSAEERHLAYLALRRAELAALYAAIERGKRRTREAHGERLQAEAELRRRAEQSAGTLARIQQRLDAKLGELRRSEAARVDAEAAEQQALRGLEALAKVKQSPGKIVVALSGAVLFKSGESELLPSARSALETVATAIQDSEKDPEVKVVGHTDSTGPAKQNLTLSRERAEAVRGFLVKSGLDPERVKAEGRGEEEPVASNSTPDGRALNRRVAIEIERKQEADR